MTIHLIDYLAHVLRCEISDLRGSQTVALEYQIAKINVDDAPLKEWTDLACYLTKQLLSFETSEEAKEFILEQVNKGL